MKGSNGSAGSWRIARPSAVARPADRPRRVHLLHRRGPEGRATDQLPTPSRATLKYRRDSGQDLGNSGGSKVRGRAPAVRRTHWARDARSFGGGGRKGRKSYAPRSSGTRRPWGAEGVGGARCTSSGAAAVGRRARAVLDHAERVAAGLAR